MALRNILAPRQQVQTTQGVPLAGGKVFLYEPGTTIFITAYRDSGLVVPHTNPIKLSASGRANAWISRDCDLRITDRTGLPAAEGNLVLEELNANPDALGVSSSGGLIPNGSFEIDADMDTVPDGWTLVSEAGATNAIDTSESTDGAQSFRFTSSGVGGGSLTTTGFFPVNDIDDLAVNFDLRSTVAAVRNIVRIEWYDVSQVFISNSDVYDSTANPLTFTSQNLLASPPALARFAKLRLIGIDPSVALAGSTFFDRCAVFYPSVVSGVFDNITIQNNDIISTNTNGDVNLIPDGTGRIVANQLSAPDAMRVRSDIVTGTPPAVELVTGSYDIYDLDETDPLATWGFIGTNILHMRNLMHGGGLLLSGENAAGGLRILLSADPDTGQLDFRSGGNTDAEDRLVRLLHQDGTLRAVLGHGSDDILDVYNQIHGGNVRVRGEAAAGAIRNMFESDPDGISQIFNPASDENVISTTTAALGGAFVDNQLTGAGSERVLTETDKGVTKHKTADTAKPSDLALVDDPHLAGWALEADEYYLVEGYFTYTQNIGNFRWRWQFSDVPAEWGIVMNFVDTSSVENGFHTIGSTNIGTEETMTDADFVGVSISGLIKANAVTGGMLDFQWSQENSSANPTTLRDGSWVRVTKI